MVGNSKTTIGDRGDDRKRQGEQLETMARQYKSRNNKGNNNGDGNELETMR